VINKNRQHQQENFTALLDNELSAGQIDNLSRTIGEDRQLRQQIARHQLISRCIRAEHISLPILGLADSVDQRLQSEPTVLAPNRRYQGHRWVQPLMGTALAASVAALGIAFAPQLLKQDSIVPVAGIQVVAQPVSVSSPPAKLEQKWKTLQTTPDKHLAPYLKDHSEYAAQGVVPYASYVSYDSRKH